MERPPTPGVNVLAAREYEAEFAGSPHLFLAGDLKLPNAHPFFRDPRLEIIACKYETGDHGRFHWHSVVTEYEYVLEGAICYMEAATGAVRRMGPGDLSLVPAGVCVRRLLYEPCRTLAVKVPSSGEKVHCRECQRECPSRQEPYTKTEYVWSSR